jgi:divalent metal cation (Fe/Co/Zn/Cd) transporter
MSRPASLAPTIRPSTTRAATLRRRIRLLVAATIGYNLAEAAVALITGIAASSTALVGFGLDSVIEVTSAAALSWQFAARDPQRRERRALRVIAGSFFALAAYVSVESIRALADVTPARQSPAGIALAAVSLVVMPVLSYTQRRAGRELGSRTAIADSKQTLLCTYLSAILLIGLIANATLRWWWADPAAALIIAAVAVREGWVAWRGDACCAVPARAAAAPTAAGDGADPEGGCGCRSACDCC